MQATKLGKLNHYRDNLAIGKQTQSPSQACLGRWREIIPLEDIDGAIDMCLFTAPDGEDKEEEQIQDLFVVQEIIASHRYLSRDARVLRLHMRWVINTIYHTYGVLSCSE